MSKFLKWAAITVASLILVVMIGIYILTVRFDRSFEKTYSIDPESIQLPTDSNALVQGKKLASLCTPCHGDNLGGYALIDDPGLATIFSPNLTPGKGGIASDYSVDDWVRAIKHGVGKDNKGLFVMPALEYNNMSKEDLSCLIAYMQTVPAVDNMPSENRFTILAKVLGSLGAFGVLFPAAHIDHTAPFAEAPEMAVTAAYGAYMVDIAGCRTCHGKTLNGGQDPNPEAPPGPNLTPGGRIGSWTEAEFLSLFQTGKTPEGKELNPLFMAWPAYGQMDETVLKAIYAYLQSLPPAESAVKED